MINSEIIIVLTDTYHNKHNKRQYLKEDFFDDQSHYSVKESQSSQRKIKDLNTLFLKTILYRLTISFNKITKLWMIVRSKVEVGGW